MALQAKVGTFNTTTQSVGNTVQVTGLGFQPSWIIFVWNGSTSTGSDDVQAGSHRFGVGAVTGTTQRWACTTYSVDGAADSDAVRLLRDDACVAVLSGSGAVDGRLDLQSFDSDGFTLVIDDAFATSWLVGYIAGGGTTAQLAGTYLSNSTTGTQAITTSGVNPDFVMIADGQTNTINTIDTNASNFCVGFMTDTASVVAGGWARDAQATTAAYGYGYNGEVIATGTSTSTARRATHSALGTESFTVNWTECAAARYGGFLAIEGVQVVIGDLLTQTDTTTDITETPGFQTALGILVSANRAQSTQDTVTTHDREMIGAFTSTTNEIAFAISDEHGLSDTEVAYGFESDSCYLHVKDDALEAAGHVTAIDSTTFTMRMTDADASQCWVGYIALAPIDEPDTYYATPSGATTPAGTVAKQIGKLVGAP